MMNFKTVIKYLFIPSLFLLSAGIVSGFISGVSNPLSIGLIILGLITLIVWIISNNYFSGFWQRRSTQAGTDTLIATLSVIVILGLINFLLIRFPYRVDLTENQLYSLSPQTEKVLQNLQQPVKVWLFEREQNNPIEREVLENYKRKSNNFSYEVIDPDRQPGLVQEFKKISQGNLSRVYLQYGDKKQAINLLDQTESLSEIKLTNAIETIKNNRIQTVYFLQGHGEHPLKTGEGSILQAVNNLEQRGYQVIPLNLAEKTAIPTNADLIILAGAKRKLFPQEVAALTKFSEQGGSILLLLDPDIDLGLEPLLKTWGIQLDQRVILDGSGSGNMLNLGPATPLITQYGNHPITQEFGNNISIYPFSRPIATVKTKEVEAVSLLITNDKMWAESDLDSAEISFDPTKDLAGPFDLGVALTRNIDSKKSKLVVIGNSTFITDGWFEQQLNGDIFLNSVEWLSNRDKPTLSIRAKEPQNRRINLSPLNANLIFGLSIIVLPLLSFILAVVTWWRRR
ncbi:ABC transporter [Aphanothece hegewaldii CCALA 016]|uniref:ABC transporter n=1 Tax=Aphanothece hegewaldii CCALA 016 TaxID=2107694 RepID=A0A2T1M3J8_9CHRO|nr:Gldg family protein [Aphanothece hegewaldii]PSF39421.1 ABC transporter [Aphanothece hegewaldii CCALA 016]